MNAAAFQLNKIRRLINTQGSEVTVKIPSKNKFNEPTDTAETFTITGVFHEVTSYLSKTTSDGSTMRRKSSPMLLCLWEEVQHIHHLDQVMLNDRLYRIGEIKNICESNVVADISLEEVQTCGESERI